MTTVDPTDFEGYGAEMMDLVNLVKDQDNKNKEQANDIKKLKGQVEDVSQDVSESNEDKFYSQLTNLVSDWRTINKDQGWLKWLAEIDALTNVTRQALLDNAFSTLDVNRVANFFQSFKGGGPELEPESKGSETTLADLRKATRDYQTGRITEEQFDKIADQVQRDFDKGIVR